MQEATGNRPGATHLFEEPGKLERSRGSLPTGSNGICKASSSSPIDALQILNRHELAVKIPPQSGHLGHRVKVSPTSNMSSWLQQSDEYNPSSSTVCPVFMSGLLSLLAFSTIRSKPRHVPSSFKHVLFGSSLAVH
jgi:hypothetical protein